MTKLKNGTWVLIADGEKALILENQTDGEDPFLEVVRKEEQENPPNREQAANRRGRFNDGPSVHRSAVDDTDWHQLAKDRFAGELADMLELVEQELACAVGLAGVHECLCAREDQRRIARMPIQRLVDGRQRSVDVAGAPLVVRV